MSKVTIKDIELQKAAANGIDDFIQVFNDAILNSINGELTAQTMSELNADQITLIAYMILRNEVMEGGFVQLIHNGYGGFMFRNPFGKMMRKWGIDEIATMMNKAKSLYIKHHETIERDCSDDEFMALYEQMPDFDELDDKFIENEERWTEQIAHYVDEHIDSFAEIIN